MDFVIYEHEDYLLIIIEEWVSTSKIQDDLLKVLRRRGYEDTVVYFDGLVYYGIDNPSRFLKADYVNKELINGSLAVFPAEVQLKTIKHFLKYPTIFDNPLITVKYDQLLEEFDRISAEFLSKENKEKERIKKEQYIKKSLTPIKNTEENKRQDEKELKEKLKKKKKDVDKKMREEIEEKKKRFKKKKEEITKKDKDKKDIGNKNMKNKEMDEDMNKKQQERRKRERREQRIREKEEREMREEIENMEEISMEEALRIVSGLGGSGATVSMGFGFVDDSGDVHEFELSGDSGESLLEQVQKKLEGEGVCTCDNCTCGKEIEEVDFPEDKHAMIPVELIEEVIIEEDDFGGATMMVPVELGLIIDDMLDDGIPLDAILDFLFGERKKMLD